MAKETIDAIRKAEMDSEKMPSGRQKPRRMLSGNRLRNRLKNFADDAFNSAEAEKTGIEKAEAGGISKNKQAGVDALGN